MVDGVYINCRQPSERQRKNVPTRIKIAAHKIEMLVAEKEEAEIERTKKRREESAMIASDLL